MSQHVQEFDQIFEDIPFDLSGYSNEKASKKKKKRYSNERRISKFIGNKMLVHVKKRRNMRND